MCRTMIVTAQKNRPKITLKLGSPNVHASVAIFLLENINTCPILFPPIVEKNRDTKTCNKNSNKVQPLVGQNACLSKRK